MTKVSDNMEIAFTIIGNPAPKERPRIGKKSTYTPAKTVNYEQLVGWEAKKHWKAEPTTAPIKIVLDFYLKRPKIIGQTVGRADLDNLIKSVLDGLQGIVFKNDNQIISICATKQYAFVHQNPRVEVGVKTND